MKSVRNLVLISAALLLISLSANAQAPLARPLADFDKLVSQLKSSSVVGEPIRAGDSTVIPFAKISFGLGGGGALAGFGGGMGGKTVPLGILIIEGDDVRAELFPEPEEKPSVLKEIIQAILNRQSVFMVNGLNTGGTTENPQDMASLLSAMMGQTNVIVNGLNVGHLGPQSASPASQSKAPSLAELKKLFETKKYAEALAMADALIAKDPKSADAHIWKGRILGSLAQGNPADMMKYGLGAMQEFEKALALDPNNPDAHVGRGVGRLMAPQGFGGDVDGAIADFEAAIAKKPSPGPYYYLGEALKNKGQNDKAAAAYKKALELKPDYPEAAKALAEIK